MHQLSFRTGASLIVGTSESSNCWGLGVFGTLQHLLGGLRAFEAHAALAEELFQTHLEFQGAEVGNNNASRMVYHGLSDLYWFMGCMIYGILYNDYGMIIWEQDLFYHVLSDFMGFCLFVFLSICLYNQENPVYLMDDYSLWIWIDCAASSPRDVTHLNGQTVSLGITAVVNWCTLWLWLT